VKNGPKKFIPKRLRDERGAAALLLTLAFLIVGTTISTSVLLTTELTSKKLIQEYKQKELEQALKATLELVRHDILLGEFTMGGLDPVTNNFKEYPNKTLHANFSTVGPPVYPVHPFGPEYSYRVALTPLVGSTNPGEFKLIAEVTREGKKLRAETKVAFLDAPKAVVTLDNWDDGVTFTEFTLASGTYLPSVDARIIAEESDWSIFTDITREYPSYDHAGTLCVHEDDNVGILLSSKSSNFFDTGIDVIGDPKLNNGNDEPSPGCVPSPTFKYYARNSVYAAGKQAIDVFTNIDNASQVPDTSDSAQLSSKTRNLGFDRLDAAFNQAITDSNCDNPNVDIYEISNGIYDPVAAGHIAASGSEYPRETVLIFDGGTNTVNEVIRGKVHMIFKGGGNTTFNANIATIGNIIVHGAGTALTFAGYLTPPRKIAGDLYVFPTDHTNPPKLVVWNAMFYKSSDMGNYIGIDRLGNIAYQIECTDRTRNNKLYNPFIFQTTSLVSMAGS
jgi:hypothetical protein